MYQAFIESICLVLTNVPRYNVAQLEQWARDQKIEDTGTKVIDTLLPIIQVSTYRVLYPSNVVHGIPF